MVMAVIVFSVSVSEQCVGSLVPRLSPGPGNEASVLVYCLLCCIPRLQKEVTEMAVSPPPGCRYVIVEGTLSRV